MQIVFDSPYDFLFSLSIYRYKMPGMQQICAAR